MSIVPIPGMRDRYGATPAELQVALSAFGSTELLPIVSNPHAPLSPRSGVKALGKIPSFIGPSGAVGLTKWTERTPTLAEVKEWARVPDHGIGVQGRKNPALDCDINDQELAFNVRSMIDEYLPNLPTRGRDNAHKFLVAFHMDDPGQKRTIKTEHGVIEFLASGQQWLFAGTHTSGERYHWDPESPVFPTVSREAFEKLWSALREAFEIAGSEVDLTDAVARSTVRNKAVNDDPVAAWLVNEGKYHDIKDGRIDITCPFESEHTTGVAGDTSTSYFAAHTHGYAGGAFVCQHAHCRGRSKAEFLDAIGYREDNLEDFDPLTDQVDPSLYSGNSSTESVGSSDFDPVTVQAGASPTGDLYSAPTVQAKAERLHLEDWDAFADRPAPEYLIDDILPQAALAVLFGAPGSGKSFSIIDMCMAIARGGKWRDKDVKQGGVLYVAAEGAGGVAMRLRAYREYHEPDASKMEFMVMSDAPDMMKVEDVKLLIKRAITIPNLSVIVLDTLAQVTPGANENASEDMGKLINHCRALHKHTGALVILVHHSGKNAAQGARGHSSLLGAADAMLEVVADITTFDGPRCLTVTKMKDGEMFMEFPFRLNKVDLGQSAKGKALSSCVVLHTNESPKMAKGPKSEHAAIAFKVFNEIIDSMDQQRIDHTRWVLAAEGDFIDTRADPTKGQDPRRQNAARGIKKLVEQKYVELVDGWYIRPRVPVMVVDGEPIYLEDMVGSVLEIAD
jgi:hypothetical protein